MIEKELVTQEVCQIIESARPKLAGLIKPATLLTPELGVDSLVVIEVMVGIEERFGISLGEFEEFDSGRPMSTSELADLVVTKLQEAGR